MYKYFTRHRKTEVLKVYLNCTKELVFTLLSICLVAPSYGQHDLDLIGKNTQYLGEVKTVTRELYKPVYEDDKLVSFRLKPMNIYPNVYRDHFNEQGQIFLREGINPDCDNGRSCVIDRVRYTYEGNNLIKKEKTKANDKLVSRHVYAGDSIMFTRSGLTKKTKVNRNGSRETQETEGFNAITLKTVTLFNNRDLPIRFERYWLGELKRTEKYTYKDSLSDLIVVINKSMHDTNNTIEKNLSYDKHGNLLTLENYYNGVNTYGYIFEYKYDEVGNWIESIMKNADNKVISKVVKVIEYR